MGWIRSIGYIIILGLASHFIGESLPREPLDPCRFPFAPWRWERGGKVYRVLKVQAWKRKVPDMSRISPGMVRKAVSLTGTSEQVARVARETCVAEVVHWALLLLSFPIYLLNPCPLGALLSVLYGLSQLPFIIIQRYNRPTLVTLAARLKQREERIRNARTDTLGQHR